MDIEDMRRRRILAGQDSRRTLSGIDKIVQESYRTIDVALDCREKLEDIEGEFQRLTGLDRTDISFLFFATAMQCVRQYLLPGFKERGNDWESAKDSKKQEKGIFDRLFDGDKLNEDSKRYHAPLTDIIAKGVPYDATWGSPKFNIGGDGKGMGGKDHRFKTLGHDPLLGWVFGTGNIMTNTLTDWEFSSYHVKTLPMADGRPMSKIVQNASTRLMLEKVWERAKTEPEALAASVIKQGLHLKSDEYSKAGLPIPVISSVSPKLAQQLAEIGIDMGNLKIVGKQASMSALINMLIGMIHGLFYDEAKYGSLTLYEVKTRKILSYSNAIASTSNIIYSAVSKDLKKLDVGGLLVTIYRLISDSSFIRQVKEEFVFGEFNKLIQGEEYSFEEEI